MKKSLSAVLVLMLSLSLILGGCGNGGTSNPAGDTPDSTPEASPADTTSSDAGSTDITIGISTDSGASCRPAEVLGIYEGAKAAGWTVVEQNADNDSATQVQQVRSMVDQGVDVLSICAVDMNAIQPALDYAQEKGVIVTLYDREIDHPAVEWAGAYDSYSDGKQCGEYIASIDDGEEHVVFELVGMLGDPNGIARRDGFHSVIDSHTNLQVVQINTEWDVEQALTGLQNALQKYSNPWAIYNASSHMDGSIKTAFEEAGVLSKVGEEGHVHWVTLGSEPPSLDIARGGYTDCYMVIPFDTIGFAAFDAIKALMEGNEPAERVFYAPTFPIMQDELESRLDEIWLYRYADLVA